MSEIQQHFLSALSQTEEEVSFNVVLSFRFQQQCVRNDTDLPGIGEAMQWQELEPNEYLYFTHGQYANRDKNLTPRPGLALEHIVKELDRKPTTRRALFSLLHTGDIVDTGDKPIPSLVLSPGRYVVAGTGGSDMARAFCDSVTTVPQISFGESRYTVSPNLVFPGNLGDSRPSYFGPNFLLMESDQ